MSKYALAKGVGMAAEKAADDIGERLKQERLAGIQGARDTAQHERKLGIIDIQQEGQTARDTIAHERQTARDKAAVEAERGIIELKASKGVGPGGSGSRSEYGRAYDDIVRTTPGISPEDARKMAKDLVSKSKSPSLTKFVGDNLEKTMVDDYGKPLKIEDPRTGELRAITQEEAVSSLKNLYDRLNQQPKTTESESSDEPKKSIIMSHPDFGEIDEDWIQNKMNKHGATRDEILRTLGVEAAGKVIRN